MRWTVSRRFAISILFVLIEICAWGRTRPHYGGTIHVEIAGDPWERPSGVARRLVYDGLTQFDSFGSLQSSLAVSWEQDNSYHRWQFRLRPGVRFHDGTALTSATVIASLNASCSAHCPWDAVKAVGSLVIFTNDSPMPNLPSLLASDQFLIALTSTAGASSTVGVGTGPFQVNGFTNGVLALIAYENSWSGRPFADAIEVRVHRAVRDQWLDLSLGRADVVEVPAEQLRQAQQQRLSLHTSPPVSLLALLLRDDGALANVKVRAAIAASVDRSSIYNVIFQKQGEATASLLPARMSGYAFLFPTDRDLNKAHELRGGLGTTSLTMSVEGDGAVQLAAQRISLNLREAGFNVQTVPAGTQRADVVLRTLSIAGDDPAAALERLLWDAGVPAPVTEQLPDALYKQEKAILDSRRIIPLLDLPMAYANGARLRDLRLRADATPDLAYASLEDTR
jgi:peptide/nickel transport system substrate-binding protein